MSPRGDYTGLEKLNENATNKKSIVQLFSIGVSDFKLIFLILNFILIMKYLKYN